MKTIYFITSNNGKFIEANKKLSSIDIRLIQKMFSYPEIQANTLKEVACFGIEYLKKKCRYPFFIEDAGLFINYLYGFPGVYSSYVFQTIGCHGILKLLEDATEIKRDAVFRSIIAYVASDQQPVFFKGECPGRIANIRKGDYGFGYDPIFIPTGELRTFAEMGVDEKNSFSHRGKSLEKLMNFFKNK